MYQNCASCANVHLLLWLSDESRAESYLKEAFNICYLDRLSLSLSSFLKGGARMGTDSEAWPQGGICCGNILCELTFRNSKQL